jgi:ParB/RepB/Spo0J family partition protein
MKTQIVNVRVDLIDANPWRDIKKYPFVKDKIAALVRSINDVGLWEGVIARKAGRRYQLAFGHHRLEAAKKAGLKTIPLIVRDLTDEQMLQFMGRENLEDYNADFMCMFESWEAALRHIKPRALAADLESRAIASTLGWTRKNTGARVKNDARLNDTADACSAAASLIAGGYLKRDVLDGLSVDEALRLCTRSWTRMEQLQKAGEKSGRAKRDIEAAKRQVARGAKTTAEQVREGDITIKQVRSAVDSNTHVHAAKLKAKARMPLFAGFARALENQIGKMVFEDSAADKIDEIIKALPNVELEEDRDAVLRLVSALGALSDRAAELQHEIAKTSRKNKVIDLATQRKLLGEG